MVQTPSIKSLLLRLFAGIAGGLIGMILALLVLFGLTFAQLGANDIASDDLTTSITLVAVLAMVFIGTMASNLMVSLLLTVFEREKYSRTRSLLFQVFLFTFILFLFFLPSYLLTREAHLSIASVHFLSSALMTALIAEIMSGWRNSLTGLLGVIVSGCFLFGIYSLLALASLNNSIIIIFGLPIAWIVIQLGIFLIEILHGFLYNLYGTAPLSPEQDHGDRIDDKSTSESAP